MAIDFTNHPKKSVEELNRLYPQDILLIIEDVLSSKKAFEFIFQDLVDIMKYGFEDEKIRKRSMHYKFKRRDKTVREMQLNHLIANLIFWNPLLEVDKVGILDESWIFNFSTFNTNTLREYIDSKLLPVYDTDFASQNTMVDEICHNIICISRAFCLLMGMGVSLYDLHQLELRDPEVHKLMRDPIDNSLEPHEVEELLTSRNKALIERMVKDPVGNDYKPFFASGAGLKAAQFREYVVGIGYKADINGNTVPILIDKSFLFDGLSKPSYVYLNAIGGRKALILSKLKMGQSGAFSKKLTMNSLTSTLREDKEICDSIASVEYHIINDDFLKLLHGRYYYDEHGQMHYLEYEKDKDLIGKVLRFRSPATCSSDDGVCACCYGHMFSINQSMASPGALASLKITEPIGQTVLSAKHSQSTSSSEIKFTEGYDELFETNSSMIALKDDIDLDEDLYIRLNNIQVEEMDDTEFYYVESFDIVKKDGSLVRRIEETSGARLYLRDRLISMYKAKLRTRSPEPVFPLEDMDDDDELFTIEVKNKELTEPLKIFTKILNTHEHMGATTVSELCQIFAEKLIQMGIKYELVHAEMIIRALLRKKSNPLEFPDFSPAGNPRDVQILKLDEAQMMHPSVLMSIPYGYLKRQLLSPELYEKTKTGPLDALYVSQLSKYIN